MASAGSSAAVDYLLARMAADLDFLVSQSLISVADAQVIRSRLPVGGAQLSALTSNLAIGGSEPSSSTPARAVPPPPARLPIAAPPAPNAQHATALWAYESGNADDLRFAKGDVIEVRRTLRRRSDASDHRDAQRALDARPFARSRGSVPGKRALTTRWHCAYFAARPDPASRRAVASADWRIPASAAVQRASAVHWTAAIRRTASAAVPAVPARSQVPANADATGADAAAASAGRSSAG